jgi:hypothetical protein
VTRRQLVLWAAVWAAFAACAVWRSPAPGINEPHYLCKAKHFSDPAWCAADFFIASADVHRVFFWIFGPLLRVLSFEQTAWTGRIVTWGLLAFGWVRLTARIVPGRHSPLWSAAIFLALQATVNLSGEWLIGGVEAKGFSYAALLLAIAAAGNESWIEAGIEAGLAISFHPVVGVWGAGALAAAGAAGWASKPVRNGADAPAGSSEKITDGLGSPSYKKFLSAALCLLFALPGLIPAVAALADRPAADQARIADIDQVFYRLKHHLDPAEFTAMAWLSYGGLLIAWVVLRRFVERNAAERFFARFILATLAIAGAGLIAGLGLRSPALMKFYPFRLVDLFLPIAVSIAAASFLETVIARMPADRQALMKTVSHIAACAALAWTFLVPGRFENPCRWPRDTWSDFVDACRWIERHTPPEAVFLTPKYNVGFKWYAQRAEYFTWKDCPQDAAGILEWARRHNRVARWAPRRSDGRISGTAVAEILKDTNVSYLLSVGAAPESTEPLYANATFSVALIRPARE